MRANFARRHINKVGFETNIVTYGDGSYVELMKVPKRGYYRRRNTSMRNAIGKGILDCLNKTKEPITSEELASLRTREDR